MRRLFGAVHGIAIAIGLFVLVALAFQSAPVRAEEPMAVARSVANAVLEGLQAGDGAAVVALFDETMKAAMPAEPTSQLWASLVAQVGALKSTGKPKATEAEGYRIVFVPLEFENAKLLLRVAINAKGEVAGLFIVPAEAEAAAAPPPPPIPADAPFIESDVHVGEGGGALHGTLTSPKGEGPFPAVVLVHGSGPNDRDESVGKLRPFRDLAHGLASRGVAVLRYEKRTKQHQRAMASIVDRLTTRDETENDALLAVALLARTKGIDASRVVLAGHSLGGTLAPRMAARTPLLAGVVVLEGATRSLPDIVVDQYLYLSALDGGISAEEQAAIDSETKRAQRYREGTFDASTPPSELPLGLPGAYWLDLRSYDPVAVAQHVPIPFLIVQGGRDYQVTMDDYGGWKRGLSSRKDVTFKLYAHLNHLLVAGTGTPSPAEYEVEGHVDEQVINDIAAWIAALPRGR